MKVKIHTMIQRPVGRTEMRIAEKEFDEVNKNMLPFIFAYEKTNKENWELANSSFMKEAHRINKNKKFVRVNINAFSLLCSYIEQDEFIENIESRKVNYAYYILALIFVILLLTILT